MVASGIKMRVNGIVKRDNIQLLKIINIDKFSKLQGWGNSLDFSETLGAPYDPHSSASTFRRPSVADNATSQNIICLPAYQNQCLTKEGLDAHIGLTLSTVDEKLIASRWNQLL